jgi:hypothetical protein
MVDLEPLLSRRAALRTGAGVAAVALAGCGADVAVGPAAGPADDADLGLLRGAVQREEQLRAEVGREARRLPRLRAALQRVSGVHEDHVEVLSRSLATPPGTTAADVGPRLEAPAAVRRLARSERSLAQAHADAALEARSGPFARVLAGMAAAAEQQAQVLDALVTSVGRRG